MSEGLRVGIVSQTPYVRPRKTLEALEGEHGPLGDPIDLDRLTRGVDYSVTPGGVARMIAAAAPVLASRGIVAEGEWVTLSSGFPRDLALGNLRLGSVTLPRHAREGYGHFKEIVWEALNGLPPRIAAPLTLAGHESQLLADFETWSRVSAEALLARSRGTPYDVTYLNDWQLLPQWKHLPGPRVFHLHTPFADWTPPGWRDYLLDQLRHYEAVVVSTRAWRSQLERAGFERPVHVVRPWLDPSDYPMPSTDEIAEFCARFGLLDSDEVVLNVGRMDPVKGQDELLRAMPSLLEKRPNARLLLVGNGSFSSSKRAGMGLSKGAQWRAKLESLASELGVRERVVFTGHVPHVDALRAFARANAFAFPSVAEGFGLAVVEAWLYGKPAVVSPRAGVADLVENGENGFVVERGNPAALADALATLLADPSLARDMGERARRTAQLCSAEEGAEAIGAILQAHAERAPRARAGEVQRA